LPAVIARGEAGFAAEELGEMAGIGVADVEGSSRRYLLGVRVCGSVTGMIAIHKKIVVDERGKPQSVLIPWEEFCELSEALGLDLDKRAKADLRATRRDLKRRKSTAFKPLSEI